MPEISMHHQAASENRKALKYLQERVNDFPQWCVTVAFYTAVHIAEAVLAKDGIHSDGHLDRNQTLKLKTQYAHIWKKYRPLWNDSLIARYLTNGGPEYDSFTKYMKPEEVIKTHVNHHLAQIIKSARKLLKDNDFMAS